MESSAVTSILPTVGSAALDEGVVDKEERLALQEVNDYSWTHKCVVHGLYYWIAIVAALLTGLTRFIWTVHSWFQQPHEVPLPRETFFWLLVAIFFPVALHVFAAWAEVRLNKRRRRRYVEKNT